MINLANGYYYIESVGSEDEKGGIQSSKKIEIDESKKFEIEVNIKPMKKEKLNPVALIWGRSGVKATDFKSEI